MTAWSATRSEVRLQVGIGLTSLHLPPRCNDVAHAVTDEICRAIAAQALGAPRTRRHLRLLRSTR